MKMNRNRLTLTAALSVVSLIFCVAPVHAQQQIELRNAATGLCLDAKGVETGDLLSVDDCNNVGHQKFSYKGDTIIIDQTGANKGANYCLSVTEVIGDGSLELFKPKGPFNLVVYSIPCYGGTEQSWILESDGRLRSSAFNACIAAGAERRVQVYMDHCDTPADQRPNMIWSTGVKNEKWVRVDQVRTIAVSSGINDVALAVAWAAGYIAQQAATGVIDAGFAAAGLPIPIGDTIMQVVAVGTNFGLTLATSTTMDGEADDLGTAAKTALKGLDSIFAGPDDLYITMRTGGGGENKIWPSGRSSVDSKPGSIFKILTNHPLQTDVEFTLYDEDTLSDDDLGGLKIPANATLGTYVATIGREEEDAVYQMTYTVYLAR